MSRHADAPLAAAPRVSPRPFLEIPSSTGLPSAPEIPKHVYMSYPACVAFFLVAAVVAALTPFKEYYLGSYVTESFSEIRDDIVSRKLNPLGVVSSGVHFLDTFDRPLIPLYDLATRASVSRVEVAQLLLPDFLVRASVRRADVLAHLPQELLSRPINLMEDLHAPLCSSGTGESWISPAQQLFGNWFPTIRHEFCRDFSAFFSRNRFFTSPAANSLKHVGTVPLGLIAVGNMSEVHLRHFDDASVIRKIMKHVHEGFLGIPLPAYTDDVADAVVTAYARGITLAELVTLLPGSFDIDHISLVDLLGIQAVLDFYLEPQQLTMGVNVNGEAAILAEVTHATSTYFTTDFLINTVGMHLVSTVHLAPFWDCAIRHTTMQKNLVLDNVDSEAMKRCGRERAAVVPTFIVNLMYLFQKEQRDYKKLDNTTTYTLGYHPDPGTQFEPLQIPDKLTDSLLLSIDGRGWTKPRLDLPASSAWTLPPLTPYGYLFTPDCRQSVEQAKQSGGRNVQKYQAFVGDGLGNCVFRDSQETPQQTLCRLFMPSNRIIFQTLADIEIAIPSCTSLLEKDAPTEIQEMQQMNLRQIEWFLVDTIPLKRRIRIHDNTSRQIRTFLLIMNLVGAVYYVLEYLRILKSVWIFIHNSFYKALRLFPAGQPSLPGARGVKPVIDRRKSTLPPAHGLKLQQILYFDPTMGAIHHPGTMALLYLGAVGALSNVFSLVCSAELVATDSQSSVVIVCQPSIPLSSLTLMLTTLSSTYWICQVTLQTRTLAERLDHAANPSWHRSFLMMVTSAAGLHFFCKAGAQFLFQNVELRSDPHLYAVVGGFFMSWLIVLMFAAINFRTWRLRKVKAAIVPRRWSFSAPVSSTRLGGHGDPAARERSFLAKWGSGNQDDAYHHCATPFLAHQLQAFVRRQAARLADKTQQTTQRSSRTAIENLGLKDARDAVGIHEFVMIHCVGGAAKHLESVAWRTDPGSETAYLTPADSLVKARR